MGVEHVANKNNVAGRFLGLVNRALELKVSSQTIALGCARMFGIREGDLPELFRMLGLFAAMPKEAERQIREMGTPNPGAYLGWVPPVLDMLNALQPSASFANFLNVFTTERIGLITICDDQLTMRSTEGVVDVKELKQLLQEVRKLLVGIQKAEIEHGLREFLLRHLLNVEAAIVEYQFLGAEALRRGISQGIGICVADQEHYKRAQVDPTGKEVIRRVRQFVSIARTAVEILLLLGKAADLVPLVGDEPPLLEHSAADVPADGTENGDQ